MDTFPGLVVYTALLGLSRNTRPWNDLTTGENILFSQDDFTPPFTTRTWRLLAAIRDPEVDQAATLLKGCCAPDWSARGSLEELLTREKIVVPPPRAPTADAPWWVKTAQTATPEGGRRISDLSPSAPILVPKPAEPVTGATGSRPLPPPPGKQEPSASTTGPLRLPNPPGGRPAAPPSNQPTANWHQRTGPVRSAGPPEPDEHRLSGMVVALLTVGLGLAIGCIAVAITTKTGANDSSGVAFWVSGVIGALLVFLIARSRR
jgi:hypothetical protein